MKKEMKIVLPFYKIAYAVSFVVILSVIRAVVFTYEIGLSIEPPFAILTAVFCADTYVQEITSNRSEVQNNLKEIIPSVAIDKKENLFYYTETDDTGNFFAAARCSWIWIVFCVSETSYTSSNRK